MAFTFAVSNPSDYSRKGYITLPWQPVYEQTGIPENELILHDSHGNRLPVQIDHIDPENPARDTLIFSLIDPIEPETQDYVTITQKKQRVQQEKSSSSNWEVALNETRNGITLENNCLTVAFNLIPSIDYEWQKWYAGSANSILFENKEILDAFRADTWFEHDPEKRCMQVDQLQVCLPFWKDLPNEPVDLFKQPYQLISSSIGPLRVSITIVSKLPDYKYADPLSTTPYRLECELYRVLSLYHEADYVIEELFVKGKPISLNEETPATNEINPYFIACYFAYMDMSIPERYQMTTVPDWFAVGYPWGGSWAQHPGYGFATDVHTETLVSPLPDFPNQSNAYKTFSWKLYPCNYTKCLHLFMNGFPGGFDSRTGHAWYECIYKPLSAKFKGE